MISEAEAPRYLWKLVRDLSRLLENGEVREAERQADEALSRLRGVVYSEHLTRAQIRGLETVASLLHSGRVSIAHDLVDGELRNSFPSANQGGLKESRD